uniref:Uncharacterized protein n=1 Tax=Arundo donax TaxID=35708 RepID=A0A0A9AUU5_ARUDO
MFLHKKIFTNYAYPCFCNLISFIVKGKVQNNVLLFKNIFRTINVFTT